ncbi:MAG TPA: hypothetical protein VJ719_11580 [Chthoniobacterales bacterium]|nr:hypothetical protein [Chthoniobacterales bacterium]
MNSLPDLLEPGLRVAAVVQLAVAVLNLSLIRIMKWKPDLDKMPLLVREVFRIHCYFISITLAIFGVITWRFAGDIATAVSPITVWLATGIGLFWLIRSGMQWLHYSPSHWRGDTARTLIHFVLFFGYGALATVYLMAGFRSGV